MWIVVIALIALALLYWFIVRPILAQRPELKGFYDAEAGFFTRINERLCGLKTILIARMFSIVGVVVEMHDQIAPTLAGTDVTPIIPAQWVAYFPLFLLFVGIAFEWLRKITTTPVSPAADLTKS